MEIQVRDVYNIIQKYNQRKAAIQKNNKFNSHNKKFKEILQKGTLLENKKLFKSIQFNKTNVPEKINKLMKNCEIIDLIIKNQN